MVVGVDDAGRAVGPVVFDEGGVAVGIGDAAGQSVGITGQGGQGAVGLDGF